MKKFIYSILLMAFVVSCNNDDEPVKEVNTPNEQEISIRGYDKVTAKDTVRMKSNVIYVKNDINKDLVQLDESQNIITFNENPQTKDIIAGDVLYSKGTGDFSDAYAVKVNKVTKANGKIVCTYEQATLGEVFEQLHQKQEFEVEEKGISGYDIEEYLESLKGKTSGRALKGADLYAGSILDDWVLKVGDSEKFKVAIEKDKIKITSIVYDVDRNYKTIEDQAKVKVVLDNKDRIILSDLKRGKFTSSGTNDFDVAINFSFGRDIEKVNEDLKNGIKRANSDIEKEVKQIGEALAPLGLFTQNKIEIAKIPLLGKSVTDLVFKPVLKVYLVLEANIEGEFEIGVDLEYKFEHVVELSLRKQNVTTSLVNKKKKVNVQGSVGAKAKIGAGLAFELEFPAFKRTTKSGKKENSLVGFGVEPYLGGNIKGETKFTFDTSQDINEVFYIKGVINGGLYYEPNAYGKFGFWRVNEEFTWNPKDAPYTILTDLSYNFGYYLLPPNMEQSFYMKNSKDVEITNYNEEVALARYDKTNAKVTLTGNDEGNTMIHFSDKSANFKKGDVIVSVLGNKRNQSPTKPELVVPVNNHECAVDSPVTLTWLKSTDPDSQLRYEVFIKKPGATNFEKESTLYKELTYDYTPQQTGQYSWKVVVSDGQERAESDINIFTTKKEVPTLALSTTSVQLNANANTQVQITAGSGSYSVSSSNSSVATAQLSGTTITVTGVAQGATNITVTDTQSGQTQSIVVTVNSSTPPPAGGNGTYPTDQKVFVQGGTFMMGSNDGGINEKPVHQVTLNDFYIGKYEVTNAQFAAFLNAEGNQSEGGATWLDINSSYCQIEQVGGVYQAKAGKENYPVMEVTWYGANAYAEWVGGRLPTEAEWEYAARGGNQSQGYTYAGSNTVGDVAWYSQNSTNPNNDMYQGKGTHPVGQKQANELGIYDMSGNVWEWCNDWYSGSYYDNSPTNNPTGPSSGSNRVLRGGSWNYSAYDARVANRGNSNPYSSLINSGFRVVFLP